MLPGTKRSYAWRSELFTDDLSHLFCSKTVAVCYKAAGLLAPNRKAHKLLPKHWSETCDDFLNLQGGTSLGPEQRVTFESVRFRRALEVLLKVA
jgi:hypothetical protein